MNSVSYFFAIAAASVALLSVVEMLRRQRFRERHAFWWLLAALLSVVVSVFPATLEWASSVVGVEVPSNLAFFVSIIILFFVTVQHSSELTTLEEKTRTLAEHTSLIELRLGRLAERLDSQPDARDK
ncbi:DUF2304 domain-containing protein [Cryobacterium sp. PH31-O1]|uniref:DUF2304 domain-containing protein n=1 Tax=Cryobacterium sp. PH31-O1 TaxID=3046306 RepID=UPI0024BBAB78|nr:DUF2304 domain-containing protein [Cryobacterium sp. PH31-O1]MDJ0337576.1 DUF2304 domain-containing protein [Cryobacterium sp. PH31-O1]